MSKRIWHHPDVPAGDTTVSWRSVGQLEDTPAFREWLDREFPRGAAQMDDEADLETSRRSFLKIMGASTALAGFGLASCRRPENFIVPYAKAPEWVIPGKATYYASSMPSASGATPLVVTSFEGRPTKVAPNTLHPDVRGTDAFAQASVLDLYSPSRSRQVLYLGKPSNRADFEKGVTTLASNGAAKVAFVIGNDDSPTRTRLLADLAKKYSAAKFYSYEALEGEKAQALGAGNRLVVDYAKADRVVALDSDLLCLDSHGPVAGFFNRRKPEGADYSKKPDEKGMNRLYAIESLYTMTGGMADHRLRVAPSQILKIAAYIAAEMGVSVPSGVETITDAKHLSWLAPLIADLKANGGRSAVIAGSRQPAAVQMLALAINQKLGNVGDGKPVQLLTSGVAATGDIAALTKDLNSGAIETLILLTPSNPVYDAPSDLKFAEALSKAKTSIHFGMRTDATAQACTWHIPVNHYLESWTDARTSGGVHTIVQPMILPLYSDCVSELEFYVALLAEGGKLITGEGDKGAPSPAYTEVRKTFTALANDSEEAWKKFLHDGFLAGSAYKAGTATVDNSAFATAVSAAVRNSAASDLEVIFATDASVLDGRWIDNGWLQEAPDPISKLTWDNAALIAPQTAKDLGIYDKIVELENAHASMSVDGEGEHRKSPMIKITVNGVDLTIPVLVAFGQAEKTIIIPLGYGQGFDKNDKFNRGPKDTGTVGLVGVNAGFNAYPLRTSATSYFATGAKVQTTTERYPLALTQEHNAMYGRALAREISTLTDNKTGNTFAEQIEGVALQGNDLEAPANVSLYKQEGSATWHPGTEKTLLTDPLHQWGMSIDLSACMGCNACLVACQAENNIPIVGKEQLARGREMHWIRMDRYFAVEKPKTDAERAEIFDIDSPAMVPQPVACQQCESAPCETVCPVNATIHTEDGLNAMAYNRCIGTRYCANNCPYKARRFNFFDYNKRNPLIAHNLYKGPFGETKIGEAPHLQRNPNVTVRMRGVMEKCTYCVQRLKDAKIRQKRGQKQEFLASGKPSDEMTVTTATLRIPVDSVKVACQEACPAGGIEFGNLKDGDKSTMVRAKASGRNYELLHYIGTRPRTTYLARVKNPNGAMPDAHSIGKATINM